MAYDEVTIYNLALGAVGARASVNRPDERTREAIVCRQWFEAVRDTVFRAAPWSSLKGNRLLPLLRTRNTGLPWVEGDPDPEWAFAYGLPDDFIYPRNLQNFSRFEMSAYGDAQALMTNEDGALLSYTRRVENPSAWDIGLYTAIHSGLAAHICLQLNGSRSRAQMALQRANEIIMTERATNANQHQNDYDSMPDWLIARGLGGPPTFSRYLYPTGPMLTVGGL